MEHCWHQQPPAGLTARVTAGQVCCYCGSFRQLAVVRSLLPGHGPHLPDAECTEELVSIPNTFRARNGATETACVRPPTEQKEG